MTAWMRKDGAPSDRSPGVHVSGILRPLALGMGLFTVEDEEDEMPLRIALGLAWEMWVAGMYPEWDWQPGELVADITDGDGGGGGTIIGSPDGLSVIDGAFVIEEAKYTGKSLRVKGGRADQLKDIRNEWLWIEQVKAYCWLFRRWTGIEVRMARLHICWKYGAYEYPLREIYMRYLVEFSDGEIEATGKMLVDNYGLATAE